METCQAIYSVAQIRQIEAAFEADYAQQTPLMQHAANGIAEHVINMLKTPVYRASSAIHLALKPTVFILVGNGNNGGDGIVAALALQQRGITTAIVFGMADHAIKHPLAQAAYAVYKAQNGVTVTLADASAAVARGEVKIIVDALFGIGITMRTKPIDSVLYSFIATLNLHQEQQKIQVLAVDLPSGIDADTGTPCLRDNKAENPAIAIVADQTLSFIGHKAGLHTGAGVDYAGHVTCLNLDIPNHCFPPTSWQLFQHSSQPFAHRSNRRDVHKGTFGTACIIGGAPGMVGAGRLAARAALLCGAGKTVLAQLLPTRPSSSTEIDPAYPEIMHATANDALETPYFSRKGTTFGSTASSAIAIGPGLGQSSTAAAVLGVALQQNVPLIIDADALTLLANSATLAAQCVARTAVTVLTPHPGEAATLLGLSTIAVQQNRIAAAQQIAQKFNAIVVLKGAGSIVMTPNAQLWINQSGNPAMASGGMGDVLTGMLCAAFSCAAKNTSMIAAARIVASTVWLHGHAADACVANGIGPIGLTASEVALRARQVLNCAVTITDL